MIVKMAIEYSEIDRLHRAAARRLGERATMLKAKYERYKKPTREKSRQNRKKGRERMFLIGGKIPRVYLFENLPELPKASGLLQLLSEIFLWRTKNRENI